MLVDVHLKQAADPIMEVLAGINGAASPLATRLERGFYNAPVGNFEHVIEDDVDGWDWCFDGSEPWRSSDPMDAGSSYGTCDTPEQFMGRFREALDKDPRSFVVSFMVVQKVPGSVGGWRWHKWGPYIGDKEPQHEYLADEGPDITQATCWHVYLVKGGPGLVLCTKCGQPIHGLGPQREGIHEGCAT